MPFNNEETNNTRSGGGGGGGISLVSAVRSDKRGGGSAAPHAGKNKWKASAWLEEILNSSSIRIPVGSRGGAPGAATALAGLRRKTIIDKDAEANEKNQQQKIKLFVE